MTQHYTAERLQLQTRPSGHKFPPARVRDPPAAQLMARQMPLRLPPGPDHYTSPGPREIIYRVLSDGASAPGASTVHTTAITSRRRTAEHADMGEGV